MIIDFILQSFTTPTILFFISGFLIGIYGIVLNVPPSISQFLSLYLIAAIGFKGGYDFRSIAEWHSLVTLFAMSIVISLGIPFIAYRILRLVTTLDKPTVAALSAHYGSVSIITFLTAESFLKSQCITYAGYLGAVLALMEGPAIFSGIYLAQQNSSVHNKPIFGDILRASGCLVLLLSTFLIGLISSEADCLKLQGFFGAPFYGFLCFFLLDMGLLVARQIHVIKNFTFGLILFGIYMPLIGAFLGLLVAVSLGLDVGSATLFMVLCASASYVAVPAAMKIAIPEAKVGIYVPMALAITFPFNVIVGISLYYTIARQVLG